MINLIITFVFYVYFQVSVSWWLSGWLMLSLQVALIRLDEMVSCKKTEVPSTGIGRKERKTKKMNIYTWVWQGLGTEMVNFNIGWSCLTNECFLMMFCTMLSFCLNVWCNWVTCLLVCIRLLMKMLRFQLS